MDQFELPEEKIIKLYENHSLCKQFHGEFKSDLDLKRLPSGKFATNDLGHGPWLLCVQYFIAHRSTRVAWRLFANPPS